MRIKHLWMLSALMVASLNSPVWAQDDAAPAAQKYTLKRIYKMGETERFKVSASTNGEARMGGGEQGFPLENQSVTVLGFRVLDVKDGIVTLVNEVESLKITNNGMEMTNDQMGLDLNTLKVTFKLNDRNIVQGAPKMSGQPSGQQMMMQMFGGNSNTTNMFAVFPENPVAVGESWEHEMPNPMAQMMGASAPADMKPIRSVYTLESVEQLNGRTVLKIKQEVDMQMILDEATLKKLSENEPAGGMTPSSVNMVMKGNNYHWVDPTNGRTIKIDGQMSMNMAMKMSMGETEGAPPGFGGDFNIEATISNTVSSLAPKAAAPTKPAVTNTKPKTTPGTKAPAKPKTPAKPKGKGK